MTDLLIGLALVVVLAIAAQLAAVRLSIPAIVPLLLGGALAGDVTGLIEPDDLLGDALSPAISIAVGIILFEGALGLRREELRGGVRGVVLRLITLGALVTWALTAVAAWLLLDLPTEMAILIGAVLIVSGPTVVLPLLEFIRPVPSVRAVLKWEGILVDPIGAILAVVAFNALAVEQGGFSLRPGGFALSLAVGCGCGAVGAALLLWLLRSDRLAGRDKVAATLMLVVGAFAAADALRDDAGLVATIAMGLALANQRRVDIARIVEFKENLGSILLGILFVLLAANVDLDAVVDLGWRGLAFVGALVLLVRPAVALLCSLRSPFGARERAFIAALAPKGIVAASTASVFGLELAGAGASGAEELVPATFLAIAGTVAVYSVAAPALARALGLARGAPTTMLLIGAPDWALDLARALRESGVDVRIWSPRANGAQAALALGLPVVPDPLLGDRSAEESLLEEVSAVLLVTDDDALNALLARQLTELLQPSRVFALPPDDGAARIVAGDHERGLVPFDRRATAAELARRFAAGQRVAATSGALPAGALPLMGLAGSARVLGPEVPPPAPGELVLALTPAR